MELPEFEYNNNGTGYVVYRTIRFVGYIVVLSLLAYSLWRIRMIETKLTIQEKEMNISKILAMSSNNLQHHRTTRSAKDQLLLNSFGGGKELPKGTLLSAKNENIMPKMKRIQNKEDFQQMVNILFDKIHKMHDDKDRANFENNMKEVFQAWFPVFEALLPHEYFIDEETRSKRSISVNDENLEELDVHTMERKKSSEESLEEKNKNRQKRSPWHPKSVEDSKSSSEEKKPKQTRVARSADDSKSSSEEKAPKQSRVARSVDDSKSSEEKKPKQMRIIRSADKSSEESKSSKSTEENMNVDVKKYYKNKSNDKKKKSSEESAESSISNEKKEDKERLNLLYQTITELPDGTQRRIIVTSE